MKTLFEDTCYMDGFNQGAQLTLRIAVAPDSTSRGLVDRMVSFELELEDGNLMVRATALLSTLRVHGHHEDAYTPRVFTKRHAACNLMLDAETAVFAGAAADSWLRPFRSNWRAMLLEGLRALLSEFPFLVMHYEDDAEAAMEAAMEAGAEDAVTEQQLIHEVYAMQGKLNADSAPFWTNIASHHLMQWTNKTYVTKLTLGELVRYRDILAAGY